jgi:hypothetical protein
MLVRRFLYGVMLKATPYPLKLETAPPALSVKAWRVFATHPPPEPCVTSKTVPKAKAPPFPVVEYKSSALSKIRLQAGSAVGARH